MPINTALRVLMTLPDLHERARHLLNDPSEIVELLVVKIVVVAKGAGGVVASAFGW